MSIPSVSFWRQDLNWYVQQQSWTKSFNQVDQNWTNELSGGSSPGSASIIAQGTVNIVNTQSESPLTSALQASGAKSGSLLDLVA